MKRARDAGIVDIKEEQYPPKKAIDQDVYETILPLPDIFVMELLPLMLANFMVAERARLRCVSKKQLEWDSEYITPEIYRPYWHMHPLIRSRYNVFYRDLACLGWPSCSYIDSWHTRPPTFVFSDLEVAKIDGYFILKWENGLWQFIYERLHPIEKVNCQYPRPVLSHRDLQRMGKYLAAEEAKCKEMEFINDCFGFDLASIQSDYGCGEVIYE